MFSPVHRVLLYNRQSWKHLPVAASLAFGNRSVNSQQVKIEQNRTMASNNSSVVDKFQLPKRYQGSTPSVW